MEYTVRQARPRDYPALLEVLEQGDAYHRQALPQVFRAPDGPSRSRAYIEGLIADRDTALLVAATGDGRLAGVVHIGLRRTRDIPILVPRVYAFVYTLVVREDCRRMGIGSALMGAAHDWAISRDAQELELNVWESSAPALAFYGHLGYETSRRVMHRPLDLGQGEDT